MTAAIRWIEVTSRVAAALVGGYAFVWGFTTLLIAFYLTFGGDYDEGVMLAYLLAFLLYVCVFLWAFVAANVLRAWSILGGGGAAMAATAWLLTHGLRLAH